MIIFHNVTKTVGKGSSRTRIVSDLSCEIPARCRLAIVAHRGAGKTTLLRMLSGMVLPSSGWIERRGVVSAAVSLLRYGTPKTSARQLIERLAMSFNADAHEIGRFVEAFGDFQDVMDVPLRTLGGSDRQSLGLGLFYGLPCNFYLFDERLALGSGKIKERAQEAFERRGEEAGMILATSNARTALAFGGAGAHLVQGALTFFPTAAEAVAAFERTEPDAPSPRISHPAKGGTARRRIRRDDS